MEPAVRGGPALDHFPFKRTMLPVRFRLLIAGRVPTQKKRNRAQVLGAADPPAKSFNCLQVKRKYEGYPKSESLKIQPDVLPGTPEPAPKDKARTTKVCFLAVDPTAKTLTCVGFPPKSQSPKIQPNSPKGDILWMDEILHSLRNPGMIIPL